ncbi:MAG: transglutaminase family protein [bacterium]
MIYDIKLRIAYTYDSPAVGGRHLVCLRPIDVAGQQHIVSSTMQIDPVPQERIERRDFFGNRVTEFSIRGAHRGVDVRVQARIDRTAGEVSLTESTTLQALAEELSAWRDVGPESPLHFLSTSDRVPRDAAMTGFARALLQPGMTVAAAMVAVGQALHAAMKFDPDATTVNTPAAEAFAKRRGVCQDYSHIMIACLRGVGIPAGYVSGFLRTLPPPGKARLEGADAMHAWVRVWCGSGLGWVEYDPTNACFAAEDHIVVARGRDYSDVSPIKGTMRIAGRQKSHQAVDVIPLDDGLPAGAKVASA